MDPPTVISAFTANKIDAAGIWYPFVDHIQQRVPNLAHVAKDNGFRQNQFPTCVVAGINVTQNPGLLKHFQAATKDIMNWTVKNKDQLPKLTFAYPKDALTSEQGEFKYVQTLAADQAISKWENDTIPG